MPRISIVVPVYNERANLDPLLEELRAALAATGASYEIVLVDDGSADGSAEWIVDEGRRDERVVPVLLKRNRGQSTALAVGLMRARGDILVALGEADVVSGVRADRQDGWLRLVSSRVANVARRAWLGDPITDIGCSFKAYRREALEGLPWFAGCHRFLPALCVFRGARLREVTLRHRPRRHGQSKYGISNRLWRGLYDLVGVRWLKSRLLRYDIREVPR